MDERLAAELDKRRALFVFDLDSTITQCELLPRIAAHIGLETQMQSLTERAMAGGIPFAQDFAARAMLLRDVPLSYARSIAAQAPLNNAIAAFLRAHRERCMILSGNLDVWIEELIEKLGMTGRCLCSRAQLKEGRIDGVAEILDKEVACASLPRPFIAIGDGSNDLGMLRQADFAIAYGGVRQPPRALREIADAVIEDEEELVARLNRFL